jgi:hypothetical protein
MIENNSQCKDEVLEAINNEFNGINECEYENNVFDGKDYQSDIDWLKSELKKYCKVKDNSKSVIDRLKSYCLRKTRKKIKVDSLEGKSMALYIGYNNSSSQDLISVYKTITKIGRYIHFDMSKKTAGQTLLENNPPMAYKKAGRVLLDAFDSGAEVLVFARDSDYKIFSYIIADVEIEVGRPIPMALLSIKEFNNLLK